MNRHRSSDLSSEPSGQPAAGYPVTGTVVQVPRPGAIGIFVDLHDFGPGFVDVLRLSDDGDDWPTLGMALELEVVDVYPGRPVHLRPLDERYVNERAEAMLRRLADGPV